MRYEQVWTGRPDPTWWMPFIYYRYDDRVTMRGQRRVLLTGARFWRRRA